MSTTAARIRSSMTTGKRAPEEVYDGLLGYDGLPVEPPAPVLFYSLHLLGVGAIAVSIAGAMFLIQRIRRTSPIRPMPDSEHQPTNS